MGVDRYIRLHYESPFLNKDDFSDAPASFLFFYSPEFANII